MGMWRQKGGERIAVSDMVDSHLQNAHRFMVRVLKVLMEPQKDRLFFRIVEGFEARGWNYVQWINILAKECHKRDLQTLVDAPPGAHLIHEPAITYDMEVYNYKLVSEMDDGIVMEWYHDLSRAGEVALDYATHGCPTSDAAMDAFESEYRFALEMDMRAVDWLPLFRGEVDRRGLPDMEAKE